MCRFVILCMTCECYHRYIHISCSLPPSLPLSFPARNEASLVARRHSLAERPQRHENNGEKEGGPLDRRSASDSHLLLPPPRKTGPPSRVLAGAPPSHLHGDSSADTAPAGETPATARRRRGCGLGEAHRGECGWRGGWWRGADGGRRG